MDTRPLHTIIDNALKRTRTHFNKSRRLRKLLRQIRKFFVSTNHVRLNFWFVLFVVVLSITLVLRVAIDFSSTLFSTVSLIISVIGVLTSLIFEKQLNTLLKEGPLKQFGSGKLSVLLAPTVFVLCLLLIGSFVPAPPEITYYGDLNGDITVVIAQFKQTSAVEYQPDIDMLEVLQTSAERVGDVKIAYVHEIIDDQNRAKQLLEQLNAFMLVYGRISAGGVTTKYELRSSQQNDTRTVEFRVAETSVTNFEAFLYQGLDISFVLGMTTGQFYLFKNEYEPAISALSLAIDTWNAERVTELDAYAAYFDRARAYYALSHWDEAISDYTYVINNDAEIRAMAYTNRGLAFQAQGDFERAISDESWAIITDATVPHPWINRGIMMYEQGDFEGALYNFDQAVELNSTTPITFECACVLYYNQGRAHVKRSEFDDAIASFNTAIRINSSYMEAYHFRGIANELAGNYQDALLSYRSALSLDPESAVSHVGMGTAYLNLNNTTEAIASYTRAIEIDNTNAIAFRNRAIVYRKLGDYFMAAQDDEMAIAHDPGYLNAYSSLGEDYYFAGRYADALQTYQTLVSLSGGEVSQSIRDRITELESLVSSNP